MRWFVVSTAIGGEAHAREVSRYLPYHCELEGFLLMYQLLVASGWNRGVAHISAVFSIRLRHLRAIAAFAMALALLSPIRGFAQNQTSTPTTSIDVFVPNGQNLQWMNFWVALGAGFFADERLDVNTMLAAQSDEENAPGAQRALFDGSADIAVLPRPQFLMAVARGRPVLAFANLLGNDPINLVVQRRIAEERGLSEKLSLADRLNGLRGLRVGVAPGPPVRLKVLLATVGLNADSDIEMVLVPGPAQNDFFGHQRVDAIYAHTPYLETALVEQGGVLLVNQSAGEVAELANRQIHMLVTTQAYAAANPDVLLRVVRAIHRAQQMIHSDRDGTLAAIRRSGVELRAPGALETLVDIYEPAIPTTPEVSAEGAMRELALYPSRREPLDLGNVDFTPFVDNTFVERVIADD
jgi:NitT/TauT family transport system substrate-binding protein